MNKFEINLERVDYPLEHLYFKFENWSEHEKFLITNHNNWTKYLTNFKSFVSVDVIINQQTETLHRHIIWDSYYEWKTITPGDVKLVDEKHRKEFNSSYQRFSQIYATDKHPMNLAARYFRKLEKIKRYQNNLIQPILKIELILNNAGLLEDLLASEQKSILSNLKNNEMFVSRDIFYNKFAPSKIEMCYFFENNQANFDKNKEKILNYLKNFSQVKEIRKISNFDEYYREAIFFNHVT